MICLVILGWLLPVRQGILQLAAHIRGAGATGVVVFFAAYALSAVALVPGSLFTVGAGFAYGPVLGLAVASPASVLAATAAFVLGRTVLRDWVHRKVGQSPRLAAVDRAVGRQGFRLVLLLRLSPLIPFNLLNYALSVTRIGLGQFVVASFIGMLPVTFLYVYLGSLVTTAASLGGATRQGGALEKGLYVAGLAATALLVFLVTRTARRALDEDLLRQERATSDEE